MQYIKFKNGFPAERYESNRPGGIEVQRELHAPEDIYEAQEAPLSLIVDANSIAVPEGFSVDDASDRFVALTEFQKAEKKMMSLEDFRDLRYGQVKRRYAEIAAAGIPEGIFSKTLQTKIDCKESSINTAAQVVAAISLDPSAAPPIYKCYDNQIVSCSPEQWKKVYVELYTAGLSLWSHTNEIKLRISKAKTPAEIEAAWGNML